MYAPIETTAESLELLGDAELVRRLKLGREDALDVLLQRHRDPLYRFCCHLMTNREDAEDICQETLARAITRVDSLQTGSAFRSWLFSIARNLSVDSYRTKKRTCPMPDEEAIPLPLYSETPHDRIETVEEHQTVAEALGKLTQNHQRVLLLREVNGLSYAAIAQEMQVSQSAVETLLFRARRRLREEYSKSAVPVVAFLNGVRDLATRLAGPIASGPIVAKLAVTTALVGTGAATTGQIAPLGMQAIHHAAVGHVAVHHRAAPVSRPVQHVAPAPVIVHAPVQSSQSSAPVRPLVQVRTTHAATTHRVTHVTRQSIPALPAPPHVVRHRTHHVSSQGHPAAPAAPAPPATHPFAPSGSGIAPTTSQTGPQPVASNPKSASAPKPHVIAPTYPVTPGPTAAPAGGAFASQGPQYAPPPTSGHFNSAPVATPVTQPAAGTVSAQTVPTQTASAP